MAAMMKNVRIYLTFLSAFLIFLITPALNGNEADIEVLMVAQEASPSDLDPGVNPNEGLRGITWNIYDRLVSFGVKTLPGGILSYDYQNVIPELAESWEYDKDGTSLIFHLHRDAKFHDGSPVTAEDVKWSLDRSISVAEYSWKGMNLAGFYHTDQFVVIDDYTIKLVLSNKNKFSLIELATPIPCICNSKLAKQHATEKDPWATEWLKSHSAGGGAFKLESFTPGVQFVLVRNDEWKSGPLPKLKKVVVHIVLSPEIRKKMLEQKTIDLAYELPLKETEELEKAGKYQVFAVPIESAMRYLDMNVTKLPFNDVRVRKAIAYAIPYDAIYETIHKRGMKFYGATQSNNSADWPQPSPYNTDLKKAKQLLNEANYPNGFKTDLYLDMGTLDVVEPVALLIQQNLKKIGIEITIHKVKADVWGTEILKKQMPMVINSFGSWLNYPDYFFYYNYGSVNTAFNTMSYQNPIMDKYIDAAMKTSDKTVYEENVKAMIAKAFEDTPRIPLFQMFQDVAMLPNVHGFVFWSFRQLSFTSMYKTPIIKSPSNPLDQQGSEPSPGH